MKPLPHTKFVTIIACIATALDTLLFVTFPSDSDSAAITIMRFEALSLDTTATVTVQGEARKSYPGGAVMGWSHWNRGGTTIKASPTAFP